MRINDTGTLATTMPSPNRKTDPGADNDIDKLKQTLKDGSGSAESNIDALKKLRDLLSAKIDDGSATDDEKSQFKKIDNFLVGGDHSMRSIEDVASSLGMDKNKVLDMAHALRPSDSNNLKGPQNQI